MGLPALCRAPKGSGRDPGFGALGAHSVGTERARPCARCGRRAPYSGANYGGHHGTPDWIVCVECAIELHDRVADEHAETLPRYCELDWCHADAVPDSWRCARHTATA